jgi:hypothetical protein
METQIPRSSYAYDSAGNRTSKVSKVNKLSNITEGYSYDPIYELTQMDASQARLTPSNRVNVCATRDAKAAS